MVIVKESKTKWIYIVKTVRDKICFKQTEI